MSQLKVNALVSYSGNTVTLGTSGDTINVASGVTFNTSSNIVLPAGAVGTPSLTTSGDLNTGIFFPAADTIAFTEGGVEGMRLNTSGNVQFAKNISIGGATPTTSGFGITFPATASGSTDANTLDDYEEGTWTPGYAPDTGAAFTSIAYGIQSGGYVKIGRQVTCMFNLRISSLTKGAASGDVNLTGLPFTVSASNNFNTYAPVGLAVSFVNNPSNIRTTVSATTALIQKTFSNTSLTVADMNTTSATNHMGLVFTYFID